MIQKKTGAPLKNWKLERAGAQFQRPPDEGSVFLLAGRRTVLLVHDTALAGLTDYGPCPPTIIPSPVEAASSIQLSSCQILE